jgi:drug/metabolite transporter (DMT)-like permease
MFPIVLRLHGLQSIQAEWKLNRIRILGAGTFDFLSYVLILTALTFSPISYIAPAREIGIVLGVLLGSILLKEPFGKGRILGSSMIVLGITLVTLAN